MSTDRESPYPAYDLGLEAAYRAYCGKDCNIRLTDEMIKEVVEVYCSLGPDPRSRKVKAACTFEALCRITQTTKEDWERDFGQRLSSDLAEFSAGFFEGVNAGTTQALLCGTAALDPTEPFSTLVHETAHEILHRTSRRAETRQTGAQERYSPVARELQRPCCPMDQ